MSVRSFLRKTVATITAVLFILGIGLRTIGNFEHKSYLFALTVAVFLVACISRIKKEKGLFLILEQKSAVAICMILSVICLLVNGIWVLSFHPVQAADYQTFFHAATDFANRAQLSGKDYLAMFPHILGYSAFLSVFLRLFGQSVMTAEIVNVFLTTGSAVLLYMLSLKWSGKRSAAALACSLWIICPSKLLYNTMVLSEPYYTFLYLLFLLMVTIACEEHPYGHVPWKTLLYGLLSGVVLALVNAARPIGMIPIIAFFLWFLLLTDRTWLKRRWKTGTLFFLSILLCYGVSGRVWNSFATEKLGQNPPSVPGYSIYVGFNPNTQGSYSNDDMELFQSRYFGEYNQNAEAAQQSMLESARDRIRENSKTIPRLMLNKLGTLLGHDEGGAFYSKERLTEGQYAMWCIASNIWYYCICIAAVISCTVLLKNDRADSFWLVPLCTVGIILAQLLVEVAARYHYCLIPLLILMGNGTSVPPESEQ